MCLSAISIVNIMQKPRMKKIPLIVSGIAIQVLSIFIFILTYYIDNKIIFIIVSLAGRSILGIVIIYIKIINRAKDVFKQQFIHTFHLSIIMKLSII